MNNLISNVFKISAHVKFTNTDCDYQEICLLIKNTGLFNIKQKTSTSLNFGDDLTSKIYRDEIFLFKEITINIVLGESSSDYNIPISYFSSDLYLKKLGNIYELCLQQETSFFKKGTSMLRSLVIDNYMEDKKRADTYFILKKYSDAHKIYCKYRDYNDFSHYCIEMTFYCNPKYSDIPYHFIDTFYYNRLIYLLFKSDEYDFLCYRLYSMSSRISKDIMNELGKRFYKTLNYKRKGVELMYFYGELDETNFNDVYNKKFINSLDKTNFNDVYNKKFVNSLDKTNFNEDIKIDNIYIIDQYEEFNIKFNVKGEGEYTFKNITYKFNDIIDIKVKFKRVGLHRKDLVIKSDEIYYYKLYFCVHERFNIEIYTNSKLRSLIFIGISNIGNNQVKLKSKKAFSVTDGDVIKILKEDILGITDDLFVNETSGDIVNDPIYTDLDFKDFLAGKMKTLDTKTDKIIRLDKYEKHKIEIMADNKKYKIYLKKKFKMEKFKMENKIFVFVFNSYVLSDNTKLNVLINNYKDEKYFLEITSPDCNVLDTDFIVTPNISTLYEMRCQNIKKGADFNVKIKDKVGNFVEYELVVDLKF